MHMQVKSLLKKNPKQQQDRGAGGRVESRDMCLVALSQAQRSAKRLCPRFHLAAAWESRNAVEAHSQVPLASPGLRGAALPSPPAVCRGSERWLSRCYCPGTCWCAEGCGRTARVVLSKPSLNQPWLLCSPSWNCKMEGLCCVQRSDASFALQQFSQGSINVNLILLFSLHKHFFSLKDFCF